MVGEFIEFNNVLACPFPKSILSLSSSEFLCFRDLMGLARGTTMKVIEAVTARSSLQNAADPLAPRHAVRTFSAKLKADKFNQHIYTISYLCLLAQKD